MRVRQWRPEEWILYGMCVVLLFGAANSLRAQTLPLNSQDGINAYLMARQNATDARLEKIESMLQFGMGALFANLIAHLYQIRTLKRVAKDERDSV
jgi:hypothetical protein